MRRKTAYNRLRILMIAAVCSMMATDNIYGQSKRDDFVSLASSVVGSYSPEDHVSTPEARAEVAGAFLDSLDEAQQKRIKHALDSPERREWTNLPAPVDAGGLRLGDLNENQLQRACDLMAIILSKPGYQKMCHIMLADDQLLSDGQARPGFGTENFSLVIFGTPAATEPWGFQLDGHHIGVNLAFTGDKISMSPSFIGTQPEAYHLAGNEFRPLSNETDQAYKLVNLLSDDQRKSAVLSPKRGGLQTGPGTDGKTPTSKGVSCKSFSSEQKQLLLTLIGQWVSDLPDVQSKLEMERLASEIDQMHFSWNGATDPRSDMSYMIQGPTLIIEYACQNLGGNPLDHLHTMYRNPQNEYGGQLSVGE